MPKNQKHDWRTVLRSNPERMIILAHVLRAGAEGLSPVMYANERDWDLSSHEGSKAFGRCAYDFRRLADAGLIKLADTRKRRGALEHIYVSTISTDVMAEVNAYAEVVRQLQGALPFGLMQAVKA